VIGLLLLRGPQTLAELFTRSERLADFANVEMLGDTLDRLISRDPPLVIRIGRASGQREDRYMHLLSGPVSIESLPAQATRAESSGKDDRYTDLEARVAALEEIVAGLQTRLGANDAVETPTSSQ